jgi:Leucine-rich repeat (LRR) protein
LKKLTLLNISNCQLANLAPLSNFPLLTQLHLNSNQIIDITPVAALANLTTLGLVDNKITTLAPLAAGTNLGSGDTLYVGTNLLNCTAQASNIATLRGRGVTVYSDCP